MSKYGFFLSILLLPNTLFCADYFFAPSCTGLTDIQGNVNRDRLSSCVNELTDGINKTRQTIDYKNNETQKKVDDVNSTVKSMNLTVRDLTNDSSVRMRSEKDADLSINEIIAQLKKDFEESNKEKDLKIKQLETRISMIEKSLSEIQPQKPKTSK